MRFRLIQKLLIVLACCACLIAHVSADGQSEDVSIRFDLSLLPMNKSACYRSIGNHSVYVGPKVIYRDQGKQVSLSLTHGKTLKSLEYTGPSSLLFHDEKGERVAQVTINPEWSDVLMFFGAKADGSFGVLAMDSKDMTLKPGGVYVYNLTTDKIYTAIGDVKHALGSGEMTEFACDLSGGPLKHIIMVTKVQDEYEALYRSNKALSLVSSNLIVVYYKDGDRKRTRVDVLSDI